MKCFACQLGLPELVIMAPEPPLPVVASLRRARIAARAGRRANGTTRAKARRPRTKGTP